MLDYEFSITISRINEVDWTENIIYSDILADIQINEYKKYASWQSSDNSEIADYFIFIWQEFNNLKVWDLIKFQNEFNEKVICKIQSRDFINFKSIEPFIEILAKLT